MTAADRDKWNARYRAGAYAGRTNPTQLLARHIATLPRGKALDVACGAGRNSLFLAAQGYDVDAVDISVAALERLKESATCANVSIRAVAADLDEGLPDSIASQAYDLIVVVRYVNTPLLNRLCGNVATGGALLCEEHLETSHSVSGPSGASHRLGHGELAGALRSLELRYYREGLIADPDGRRMALAQAIAACGGDFELNCC